MHISFLVVIVCLPDENYRVRLPEKRGEARRKRANPNGCLPHECYALISSRIDARREAKMSIENFIKINLIVAPQVFE